LYTFVSYKSCVSGLLLHNNSAGSASQLELFCLGCQAPCGEKRGDANFSDKDATLKDEHISYAASGITPSRLH